MLDQKVSDQEINDILKKAYDSEDILTVLTHHDAITGTEFQYVAQDYALGLATAFDKSKKAYKEEINQLI